MPTTALAPGRTADVSVVIGNPTAAPMLVTSVTTPAASAPGFSDSRLIQLVSSCDAAHSGVTSVRTAPRPASFVIGPHASYTLTLTDAVTMAATSPSSCQGAFFAVPITVAAHSALGSPVTVPAEGSL